jgi:catechol 2,3-dioxygenase-like lactoylglutathione lyase family enzyme
MSDSAKTAPAALRTVVVMAPRFQALGIAVADMATSLAFYRSLGFEIPADADGEPHAEFTVPDGPRIMWDTEDTIRSFNSTWTAPTGDGRITLAFACDDPADVDATYERLVAAGHKDHLAPWDAFWGQRYASVFDPDGNSIELYAELV